MLLRALIFLLLLQTGQAFACDRFISLQAADWRAQRGDDPSWSAESLKDGNWAPLHSIAPETASPDHQPGFLWYRLQFQLQPEDLRYPCALLLGWIQEVDEVFVNGVRVGGEGRVGQHWYDFVSAQRITRAYAIPAELLHANGANTLAIRSFSVFRDAGLAGGAIGLGSPAAILSQASATDRLSLNLEVMTSTLLTLGALMMIFMALTRRDEPQHWLLFGMVIVVMVNYVIDSALLYPLRMEMPWLKRLIFVAMPTLPVLIINYMTQATGKPVSRWIWPLALLPVPVAVVYLFNISTGLTVRLYDVWHLAFVPISIVLPIYIARYARHSIRNIGLLRAAAVILIGALFYELFGDGLLPWNFDATEVGILGMLGLFMVAFARRIAQDHNARKRLSAGVLSAQDEERRRIARELHDGLGQRLVAARLMLEAEALRQPNDQINEVARELRDTTRELRAIVHGLRPVELGEVSLRSALTGYAQRVRELTAVQVRVSYTHHGYIPSEIEEHLFRIFQEAINNAIRHGGACEVRIDLSGIGTQLRVQISDDGAGFRPDESGTRGLGLTAMAERVRLCRGHFHLDSQPGEGTTLRIEIPLANSHD